MIKTIEDEIRRLQGSWSSPIKKDIPIFKWSDFKKFPSKINYPTYHFYKFINVWEKEKRDIGGF